VTAGGIPATTSTVTTADVVVELVTKIPGVFGMHGGTAGQVATFLPGRRIPGVRVSAAGNQVHITLDGSSQVSDVVPLIHDVLATVITGPLDVFIEDIDIQ
jgi:hypothetical protein